MTASSQDPQPPLSSVRAWTYLGINLLATPGLGSFMGGRKGVGRAQMFFSSVGFVLIVVWIFKFCFNISEAEIDGTAAAVVPAWWWQGGVLAFGIGWVWSLGTSISLLLQVKKNRIQAPPKLAGISRPVPPKL